MITEDELVREMGYRGNSNTIRRNLKTRADFGLIQREQQTRNGRRGSITVYPNDTAARLRIIDEQLASGLKLQDAAYELLLKSFDLIKTPRLRRVLLDYIDQRIDLSSLRMRTRRSASHPTDSLPPSRSQLTRSVRTRISSMRASKEEIRLTYAAQDALTVFALGANGRLPRSMPCITRDQNGDPLFDTGVLMPDNRLIDWRRLRTLVDPDSPEQVTDARLAQAVGDAREVLMVDNVAERFAAHVQTYCHLPSTEFVRRLLHGHVCKTVHTPKEAMLPYAILAQIDPLAQSTEATWANTTFITALIPGMAEIGDWVSASP